MGNFFQRIFTPIRNLWQGASTLIRIAVIAVAVIIVAGIIGLAFVSSDSGRVPLTISGGAPSPFSEADYQRVKRTIQEMNETGVVFDDASRMVYVANKEQRDRLYADLNLKGAIRDREGMQLLKQDDMTRSSHQRQIINQIATQEAIEIMLEALDSIDEAIVRISFDRKNDFFQSDEENPLTATATIRLAPSEAEARRKDSRFISDLQQAIAAQVAELEAQNVVIMDMTTGRKLSKTVGEKGESDDLIAKSESRNEFRKNLENERKREIEATLARMFGGAGKENDGGEAKVPRFTVNVKIDLDWAESEFVTTNVLPVVIKPRDPNSPFDDSDIRAGVPISQRAVDEKYSGQAFLPEGSPGSEFNLPPGAASLNDRFNQYTRNEKVDNFAVGEDVRTGVSDSPKTKEMTVWVTLDGIHRPVKTDEGDFVIVPGPERRRQWEYLSLDQLSEESGADIRQQVQKSIAGHVGTYYPNAQVVVESLKFDREDWKAQQDALFFQKLDNEEFNRNLLILILSFVFLLAAGYVAMWIYRRRKQRKEEELLRLQQQIKQMVLQSAELEGIPMDISDDEKERRRVREELAEWASKDPQMIVALMRTLLSNE